MRLAIDASNIRHGGGVTHLTQLLGATQFVDHDIKRVVVWASKNVLARLPDSQALEKRHHPWLERGLPFRLAWQRLMMPRELRSSGCQLLFSPGGSVPGRCPIPAVVMSQNMLPFEPQEAATFGRFSPMRLKMRLLQFSQGSSFTKAAGVIFLSRYAQDYLASALQLDSSRVALIPHGIEPRFFQAPGSARAVAECSPESPFRLLYVSVLMPYKHQLEVAYAVARLRNEGLPVSVDFVGTVWGRYGRGVEQVCRRLDSSGKFLHCRGEMPFDALHTLYQNADGFIFASSCENLPNIMIEAMAAGLPILSSNRGPMPEVLGEDGRYFDPYSVDSIATAVRDFVDSHELRNRLAAGTYARAAQYSWERCAEQTFAFIGDIARKTKQ